VISLHYSRGDELPCMKVDTSPGRYQVYPRSMCEASYEIAGNLAEIFASSFPTGEVPEDWRVANVVPFFNKGYKVKPGNYTPASLISVVAKLLEGILRDKIYRHLRAGFD